MAVLCVPLGHGNADGLPIVDSMLIPIADDDLHRGIHGEPLLFSGEGYRKNLPLRVRGVFCRGRPTWRPHLEQKAAPGLLLLPQWLQNMFAPSFLQFFI